MSDRLLQAGLRSIYIFFYSISLMPLRDWLRFWFTFPPYIEISLNKIVMSIRTTSLMTKTVDLYMAVSCIIWQQYEHPEYKIDRESVVLDIGGHIGSFALWASRSAGKVVVFEPERDNFEALKRNIRNNPANNITAVNQAVSAKTGQINLFRNKVNSAAHSVLSTSSEAMKVDSISLDDIFKRYEIATCHFMKMDCEGAEFDIITGASLETLRKIQRISMEYHEGYNLDDLLAKLRAVGFEITKKHQDTSYQGQIWARLTVLK